jgi:hypothetical protein
LGRLHVAALVKAQLLQQAIDVVGFESHGVRVRFPLAIVATQVVVLAALDF